MKTNMYSFKSRGARRGRPTKGFKNVARVYRESKCRDCSVVVTRMDFAKILGKFTKVKIQYENSSTPKGKSNVNEKLSPNANARLKNNENGMVLIHRSAYKEHPVKDLLNSKKQELASNLKNVSPSPQVKFNVLKENNRLPKISHKDKNSNYDKKRQITTHFSKHYGLIFVELESDMRNEVCKVSLSELLPGIDKKILPSEEWSIDYFPKDEEPKEDHVYDRIAAELEDLMYNDKESSKSVQKEAIQQKSTDEFPSIMDILNDNPDDVNTTETTNTTNVSSETTFKPNLESTDVEAMLLGDSDTSKQIPTSMEVDNMVEEPNAEKLLPCNNSPETENTNVSTLSVDERCVSPSILDETLNKSFEENLPSRTESAVSSEQNKDVNCEKSDTEMKNETTVSTITESVQDQKLIEQPTVTDETTTNGTDMDIKENSVCASEEPKKLHTELIKVNGPTFIKNSSSITHIVFKQMKNESCCRSVTCPKNLKYSIELEGKPVQLMGAPEFITSLDDLEVLLQIVNDSGLDSFYVVH